MTPKAPSGTPRRSFKAEFKAWLASKAGKPVRPSPGQSPTPLAPVAPAISQEQFTDAQRPITQQQEIRTRHLMDRICAVNNSNVTRNYGTHTVHEASRVPVEPLTAEELADAKKLLQLQVQAQTTFVDCAAVTTSRLGVPVRNTTAAYRSRLNPPTPTPTPLQAAEQQRRERDAYTRDSYIEPSTCAPYVPDLFTACPAPSYEPPAPAPSYAPGGGGDFGGGGASSSWD